METLKNQILKELEVAQTEEKTNYWIGSINDVLKDHLCATISKNGELLHIIEYPHDALSTEQRSILEVGVIVRFDMEENKIELLKSENCWV